LSAQKDNHRAAGGNEMSVEAVENSELGTLLRKSQLPLSIQVYALAIICLMGGIAIGYLCRGTDTNVAPAPVTVESSAMFSR
jgi:hypothetical protein